MLLVERVISMICKICQSCSIPIIDKNELGNNSDGSINADYCSFCYTDGEFVYDVSMDEMIEISLEYMEELDNEFNKAELKEMMIEVFPTLKRWK